MSRGGPSAIAAPVVVAEPTSELASLLPGLQWLDGRLAAAVRAAREWYGDEAATDPFRGLHIGPGDAARLLARAPGATLLAANEGDPGLDETLEEPNAPALGEEGSRLGWLATSYGLSSFDLALVLIALAPELDLRYERLYAFLQDDVTRRRPTVDLALSLLCRTPDTRLTRRRHFAPDAPLLRHGLVQLRADPRTGEPPLLAQELALDGQIVRFLLGEDTLDPLLAPLARLVDPNLTLDELTVAPPTRAGLRAVAARARNAAEALRLYLHGPDPLARAQVAEALAAELGLRLLIADIRRAAADGLELGRLVRRLLREARFRMALPFLDGLDDSAVDTRAGRDGLLSAVAESCEGLLLGGSGRWPPAGVALPRTLGVVVVPVDVPDAADRQRAWADTLNREGVGIAPDELSVLADRFRLTSAQIAEATVTAPGLAEWRRAAEADGDSAPSHAEPVTLRDLFAAARVQSGQDLGPLATRIESRRTWADLVLPDDALAQLREIGGRVARRHRVLVDWGFDARLSLGKGTSALFAGPSGTGKTLAAEVLARELGLDLYRIDLAGVVSKYIGETEKNLDRIFVAAETANAILFFDEADALFGKRSEVRDSHDRYANLEIAYLLQKMEQYEGVAILATNLRANLDDAFLRRLALVVHFPFPDGSLRRRIWARIWPPTTPLAPDVDLDRLAREFQLTGGHIRNVALAAAFLAAETGGPVTLAHVHHAVRRELQKLNAARTGISNGTDRP